MPRGWELFHGRAFDNLYWHWGGSSFFSGGDVPVNPTSGVIPWNNAGTFDDSNLLRRNTSTTDLRYLVTGTVGQLFRIYKTSDNGIASPTNFERIVFGSEAVNNVFYISTEAGGTGVQRPINIGQISGANAVPVGINASPGSLTAGRALQIGFTQATPTNDVGLYFEGISGQTGDYLQANNVDFGGVVFRILSTGEIAVRAAIRDVNQNAIIGLTATGSAVNYLNVTNATTGGIVVIEAAGSDSDIQLNIQAKGTDSVDINGMLRITDIGNGRIVTRDFGVIGWTNDLLGSTVDVRLSRKDNGIAIIRSNSDGVGAWQGGYNGIARTTDLGLSAAENGNFYTNEGASALVNFTLPSAAAFNPAAMVYRFYVQDADGIKVTANTGDTIRLAGSVSGAAGNITSTTIGSAVVLVCINATEWVAESIVGTWTVT